MKTEVIEINNNLGTMKYDGENAKEIMIWLEENCDNSINTVSCKETISYVPSKKLEIILNNIVITLRPEDSVKLMRK